MPGVPSGRGCEACRKQKKKCDQAKPACSRCTRLSIECVGAGVRRFQFKEHKIGAQQDWTNNPGFGQLVQARVRAPPVLETDRTSHAFMQMFVGEDLCYDMNLYGLFLHDVPRRLGHNKALDATALATSKAHSVYRAGGSRTDPQALSAFIKAIHALRMCLSDPATAGSPDTLCSIYLITVCQGWLDPNGVQPMKHGEAMAYILQQAAKKRFEGEFEQQLVITMVIPVFIDAMMNPNIVLGPWLNGLVDTYLNNNPTIKINPLESCNIRSLIRIPDVVRDPVRHMPYVWYAYHISQKDAKQKRKDLAGVEAWYRTTIGTKEAAVGLRTYGLTQMEWASVLSIATLFAGLAAADEPDNTEVAEQLAWCRREVLDLSKAAAIHRPLGASYMTLNLVIAWATSEDPEEMNEMWETMLDYAGDVPQDDWHQRPGWMRSVFDTVRAHTAARIANGGNDVMVEMAKPAEVCVIL